MQPTRSGVGTYVLDNDSQVLRTGVSWVCHVNISFMHSMQWSMVTFIIYVLEWQPSAFEGGTTWGRIVASILLKSLQYNVSIQ